MDGELSSRDYNRFGVDIIRNRGYRIEIWDFSRLFYPDNYKITPTRVNFSAHYIYENFSEAKLAFEI